MSRNVLLGLIFVFFLVAIPLSIYLLVQNGILYPYSVQIPNTLQSQQNITPTIPISPIVTCAPRPACLDAAPPCLIPEPISGWCPPTILPSPTLSASATVLALEIQLPGIGGLGNTNPRNTTKSAEVSVSDINNALVNRVPGTFTFDGAQYKGYVDLGVDIKQGSYSAKIKFPNTLAKLIPSEPQALSLIPGDLNSDNMLDVNDVDVFLSCFAEKPCEQKVLADFNDDGIVDGIDYNILLRSFNITRKGD